MSRIKLSYRMRLNSDAIFSSGHSIPGGEDISLRMTADNKPYMPGSTLKGLLREQLENWLVWNGLSNDAVQETLALLLGEADRGGVISDRRLSFLDLHITDTTPETDWYSSRTFTALEDGIVKPGTLRSASCLNRGLEFTGTVFCDEQDKELVENSLKCIKRVGLLRNRGFGNVSISVQDMKIVKAFDTVRTITSASCLKYRIRLETPLAVAYVAREDRYRQEAGDQRQEASNYMETLNCIPGSTVRGMVVSWLAQNEPEWFENHKELLLGESTRFLYALPVVNDVVTLPTPKGFYADKQEKEFYNILNEKKVQPGHKRASIGAYCTITDNKIKGYTPKTQSIMRIQCGDDKQVFTTTALLPGTVLEGCIQLDHPELAEYIAQAFQETIWLGANRYAGYGCCEVLSLDADTNINYSTSYTQKDIIPETLYMMAVSPITMTKNGEIAGIDIEQLKAMLDVDTLKIEMCATSIVEVNGFNRTWKCASPAVIMYDSGSIFQLKCSPAPQVDKLLELERTGMGIRRSEGFGQIVFIKDFENLERIKESEKKTKQLTNEQIVRQARCRWLTENKLPKGWPSMSKSQISELQQCCERAIATHDDSEIFDFFDHNEKNRGARHGERFIKTRKILQQILKNQTLKDTLHLPDNVTCKDDMKERLRLVCDWIDLSRKGDGRA